MVHMKRRAESGRTSIRRVVLDTSGRCWAKSREYGFVESSGASCGAAGVAWGCGEGCAEAVAAAAMAAARTVAAKTFDCRRMTVLPEVALPPRVPPSAVPDASSSRCSGRSLHAMRTPESSRLLGLDLVSGLLRLGGGHDLRLLVRRHLVVVRVGHRVGAAAAGRRREVLLVGEHLGHRYLGTDDRRHAARVHAGDAAAP